MLKNLIMAFAAAGLLDAPALAADASGTYVAQTPQGPMTLELHAEQGRLAGVFHYQGADFPLVASQSGDNIRGLYKGNNGFTYVLVGSIDASGALELTMLGRNYVFRPQAAAPAKAAGAAPAAAAPAAPVNPLDPPAGAAPAPTTAPADPAPAAAATTAPSGGVADASGLQTRRGRSLQCDVPAGWSFSDSNNGVDSMSPDGIAWMSRTFLRGMGQNSPDLLLRRASASWPRLGITDIHLISSKNVNAQSKLYELDYVFRGRPAHAVVQATVQRGPAGGYLANLVTLQSSREAFQQNLPLLTAMAKSVQVTDAEHFADGGKLKQLGEQRNAIAAGTARDIGQTYIKGEEARGKVRDEGNKGADDTLRSQTRFKDDQGNQYVGPLQATRAFKHADGTVTFTSDITAPVPHDAVEISPYDYSGK